ncbi:hypothetical protein [Sphingobacterium paludis]|uniref:Uncharacterized protein n=1 Tax=Sphingobacterium paludis TaxID=1476465 RepID=A0A4R7D669_9SPHI|nr:hypothetical protein [Sphingobacterium paludis]TDS16067.1 hypothetical protein B0I21_102392 [Sphingobacterium paludis]
MNRVDLEKFGVQELKTDEMVEIDGGWNQNSGRVSVETIRVWQDIWKGFFDGLLA